MVAPKTDALLTKAGPIRNGGGVPVITGLRINQNKNCCAVVTVAREKWSESK